MSMLHLGSVTGGSWAWTYSTASANWTVSWVTDGRLPQLEAWPGDGVCLVVRLLTAGELASGAGA